MLAPVPRCWCDWFAPDKPAPDAESLFKAVEQIRRSDPDNRCCKYLDRSYYESLSAVQRAAFWQCVCTGIHNHDSSMGCYAMKPGDYTTFKPFFGKVIGDYHKNDPACALTHTNSWDASKVGENGVLDLQKLGLKEPLSMRVRVGRNLTAFNLPGAMDRAERVKFEKRMLGGFDALKKKFGGTVYSITPEFGPDVPNPNFIDDRQYNALVAKHIMFKDMDADPYLKSAGISSDWPYGRGCWVSRDEQKIIWFGEARRTPTQPVRACMHRARGLAPPIRTQEDQLRIMVMKKGYLLNEVFSELKELLDTVESIRGIDFAKDKQYGYVTSCPTNLGTGMRASVHVKLPNLTSDGTDKRAKAVAGPLGLSVRGTGGEHTPIGKDGTVDISPRARLFIKESEIIAALYDGLSKLLAAEAAAAK